MRVHVVVLTFALVVGSAAMTSATPPATQRPLRAGTILSGTSLEMGGGQPWEDPMLERSGCEYAADCAAWLLSGCNAALAGIEPAVTASIVRVGDLAGGRTRRTVHLSAPSIPPWGLWPGVVIQLWRSDCTELVKLHSIGSDSICDWDAGPTRCELRIPSDAAWMSLSGYATTAQLSWTLS